MRDKFLRNFRFISPIALIAVLNFYVLSFALLRAFRDFDNFFCLRREVQAKFRQTLDFHALLSHVLINSHKKSKTFFLT